MAKRKTPSSSPELDSTAAPATRPTTKKAPRTSRPKSATSPEPLPAANQTPTAASRPREIAAASDRPATSTRARKTPSKPATPEGAAPPAAPRLRAAPPAGRGARVSRPGASRLALIAADRGAAPPPGPVPALERPTAPEAARVSEAAPARKPDASRDAVARSSDEGLDILMIASEAVPFAKTGGLADVVAALPAALGQLGHRVTVVLPRYRGTAIGGSPLVSLPVTIGPERYDAAIYERSLGPGASAWLVDIPELYDREGLYGAGGRRPSGQPAAVCRARAGGARGRGCRRASRPTSSTRTTGRAAWRRSICGRVTRRIRARRRAVASSRFTTSPTRGLCDPRLAAARSISAGS